MTTSGAPSPLVLWDTFTIHMRKLDKLESEIKRAEFSEAQAQAKPYPGQSTPTERASRDLRIDYQRANETANAALMELWRRDCLHDVRDLLALTYGDDAA